MEDMLDIARKRAKRKKEFYMHLLIFVIGLMFLFFVNIVTFNIFPIRWILILFPIWLLSLVIHYFQVFWSEKWEERIIETELKRLQRSEPPRSEKVMEEEELELKELQKEVLEQKATKYDDSELV